MIKRAIKYHFAKGKVHYKPDVSDDVSAGFANPRHKIFHLKTRQKLSKNQITSRMAKNFRRKRGQDDLGGRGFDIGQISFANNIKTLQGSKAINYKKRVKNINKRGIDASYSTFEKSLPSWIKL
tara:strand:+ start:264 stop:635 length:372 start_codon:yes stop_codon:yes gene_type:complete